MNILAVNWLDIDNPQAGGAEVHFFELFERLAGRGHRVRLLASGWEGCNERASVRGIDVHRVGQRNSFAVRARRAFRGLLRADPPDIVIEDINKASSGVIPDRNTRTACRRCVPRYRQSLC